MNYAHQTFALTVTCLALAACVPPDATRDTAPSAAQPSANDGKSAAKVAAEAPLPIEMPRYAVGDSCTYDRTVNGKRQKETRTVSGIADGRMMWTSAMESGSTATLEFDAASNAAYRDVALANNQKISFSAPYRWVDYPLTAGKTWETEAVVKGENFTADVKSKVTAGNWEKIKVPAGEFQALKVSWKEQIVSNGSRGSGTLTYWVSRDSKCLVKATYRNTWGERGEIVLAAAGQ